VNSILCIGCYSNSNESMLLTVACEKCLDILKKTILNSPSMLNDVYWYYTPDRSFGFSPSFIIAQNPGDNSTLNDTKRISWNLQNFGGFRCGSNYNLYSSISFMKIIFKF
jgi:hypothetical protein